VECKDVTKTYDFPMKKLMIVTLKKIVIVLVNGFL